MTLNQLAYSLRKWPYDHRLGPTNKAYLSAITVTNISQSFYVGLLGGGKINWHRYGIKSRHCIGVVRGQLGTMRRPMRCILSSLCTFIYCRIYCQQALLRVGWLSVRCCCVLLCLYACLLCILDCISDVF